MLRNRFRPKTKFNLLFQVFVKLAGLQEDEKHGLLRSCAEGEITVQEMGVRACESKKQKLVEGHLVKHFKCNSIEEVLDKHSEKVSKSKIEEFVQGMYATTEL